MFKVMKFSRCGAVLALMLVAALAIGITSAIFIPRAAPAAADDRVTLVIDAGHGGIDGGAVSAAGVKESKAPEFAGGAVRSENSHDQS